MTNLITTIQAAAESLNHIFMYGDGRYFQENIQRAKLTDGQCRLMLNIISFNPVIENRMYNGEIEYEVQMFLFRKFDNGQSSLSETIAQKHVNRLDELQNALMYFVTQLTQCNDDIDMIGPRYTVGQNVTAANVDGWFIDCKLKLFNQWPTNN